MNWRAMIMFNRKLILGMKFDADVVAASGKKSFCCIKALYKETLLIKACCFLCNIRLYSCP